MCLFRYSLIVSKRSFVLPEILQLRSEFDSPFGKISIVGHEKQLPWPFLYLSATDSPVNSTGVFF